MGICNQKQIVCWY